MHNHITSRILLACGMALFVPGVARAAPPSLATVRAVSGTVAFRGGVLPQGRALSAGDRLDFTPGAWACLTLVDGTSMLVSANSGELRGAQFQLQGLDAAGGRLTVAMGEGLLLFSIPESRSSAPVISVNAPAAELAMRNGCGMVLSTRTGMKVGSRDSTLAVRSHAKGVVASLQPGQFVEVGELGAISAPIPWIWRSFVEGSAVAVGGISCLRDGEDAPVEARSAGPIELPLLASLMAPSGSFLVGKPGSRPVLAWLVVTILAALLMLNSANARTQGLLLMALFLEGILQASRVWLTAGPLRLPVGAALVGWLVISWIDRRSERASISFATRALIAGGLLLGISGLLIAHGPAALDVRKDTFLAGVSRWLLAPPAGGGSWISWADPGAWFRLDPAPLRFAFPFEILAYLFPFLITRRWDESPGVHCRFCSGEMVTGVRLILVGASRARFLWRVISEADLTEIFDALRQETRNSSTDLTRLELKFAYCSPCACGDVTLVKHLDGAPDERSFAFRGARHVRLITSLGVTPRASG